MLGLISHIKEKLSPAYVTLDGRDGTITVSEKVYNRLLKLGLERGNCIYMFRVGNTYGFSLWPAEEKDKTHTYELQYNSKTKTIGFAPTCPTVASILYEFGLPHDAVAKVKVSFRKAGNVRYFMMRRG